MLEERKFHVITDEKKILHVRIQEEIECHQDKLFFISEFITDVRHISGLENIVTDTFISCRYYRVDTN